MLQSDIKESISSPRKTAAYKQRRGLFALASNCSYPRIGASSFGGLGP